ncbi:DUF1214 domain-containing protein [Nocardia rhizosphaerihabitans]|uniref:DUF1214 domain-containing protein n=1 Tax=Nocardia rhizosphaerihabitans TaxID=1691570 RepID=A0ABQ2KIK1_9NOCA|nr:DUF1214 domain-containing protein [Nocardia rhizosphaerihabitans]GGN82791.1 hypothetical protein GCM10011610_34550 [Nocardia rhizosphaerihabitans]
MYDAEGFQVPIERDRFAIGDRDPLQHNPDGSLDIHVSRKNPGPDHESNWLPAPSGPVGITMRLYAARRSSRRNLDPAPGPQGTLTRVPTTAAGIRHHTTV